MTMGTGGSNRATERPDGSAPAGPQCSAVAAKPHNRAGHTGIVGAAGLQPCKTRYGNFVSHLQERDRPRGGSCQSGETVAPLTPASAHGPPGAGLSQASPEPLTLHNVHYRRWTVVAGQGWSGALTAIAQGHLYQPAHS